jgi:hypothetical protein
MEGCVVVGCLGRDWIATTMNRDGVDVLLFARSGWGKVVEGEKKGKGVHVLDGP